MGAGSLVFVPRGRLHAYKNVGDGFAIMLLGHTPGRTHERFFEEIGSYAEDRLSPPAAGVRPSMEEIVAIAAGYGIEIPIPEKQIQTKPSASDRSTRGGA